MKTPTNPFVLSGYYGKKWFCDREEELTILMEHLQNGRNVVLYSWRRMGKTALIRRIFEEANRRNETESVYVANSQFIAFISGAEGKPIASS